MRRLQRFAVAGLAGGLLLTVSFVLLDRLFPLPFEPLQQNSDGSYDALIARAGDQEPAESWPQFKPLPTAPGMEKRRGRWQGYIAGMFGKKG